MPRKPKARPKISPYAPEPPQPPPDPSPGDVGLPPYQTTAVSIAEPPPADLDTQRVAELVNHIDPLEIVKALEAENWGVSDEIKLLVDIARNGKTDRTKMDAVAFIDKKVKETMTLAGIIHRVTERYSHTSASGETSTSLDVTRTGVKSSVIRGAAKDTAEFLAALGTENQKEVPNMETTKGKPDDAPESGLPDINFTGKPSSGRHERDDDVREGPADIGSEGHGDDPGTPPGGAPEPARPTSDSGAGRHRPTKDTLGGGICVPSGPFANQQQGPPINTPGHHR